MITFLVCQSLVVVGGAATAWADEKNGDNIVNRALRNEIELLGVNLAGAEFGTTNPAENSGRHATHYIYPLPIFISRYRSPEKLNDLNFNIVRLPFRWERLQHNVREELQKEELRRLKDSAKWLNSRNIAMILDVHNYGFYRQKIVGGPEVSTEDLVDLWRKLAREFADQPLVIFGLMNEPHKHTPRQWADINTALIEAIREEGAENLILASGTRWSGAHSWKFEKNGDSNAIAQNTVVDPIGRTVFEAHQYFDSNSSGTKADCVDPDRAIDRMDKFTSWLHENNKLGFIGEFGTPGTPDCLKTLEAFVDHVEENKDVYIGWTYWAAGPWWTKNYIMSIEPMDESVPQIPILTKYTRPSDSD